MARAAAAGLRAELAERDAAFEVVEASLEETRRELESREEACELFERALGALRRDLAASEARERRPTRRAAVVERPTKGQGEFNEHARTPPAAAANEPSLNKLIYEAMLQ